MLAGYVRQIMGKEERQQNSCNDLIDEISRKDSHDVNKNKYPFHGSSLDDLSR